MKKKTKVKVHLQNFWNQKGSEKQKCSSWNFEITMCLWNIFFKYKKWFFFSKEQVFLKLLFLNQIHQIKDKCHFSNFCGKLWQNSRPVCYFSFKNWYKNKSIVTSCTYYSVYVFFKNWNNKLAFNLTQFTTKIWKMTLVFYLIDLI